MSNLNKMAYTAKDPHPPLCFLYLTETKSWRGEGEGETEENFQLLTHALQGVWVKIHYEAVSYFQWPICYIVMMF